jgi:hypothetical protein
MFCAPDGICVIFLLRQRLQMIVSMLESGRKWGARLDLSLSIIEGEDMMA